MFWIIPHRILLSTNGCLGFLETKSFLLIQVGIISSACAYNWRRTGNALVTTSRGEVSCRWQICTLSAKHQLWASFLCWRSSHSPRKYKRQWSDEKNYIYHFFLSPKWLFVWFQKLYNESVFSSMYFVSCLGLNCLFIKNLLKSRLPEVCRPRNLSWVCSCCHEIRYHYGTTWCLHEVGVYISSMASCEI